MERARLVAPPEEEGEEGEGGWVVAEEEEAGVLRGGGEVERCRLGEATGPSELVYGSARGWGSRSDPDRSWPRRGS